MQAISVVNYKTDCIAVSLNKQLFLSKSHRSFFFTFNPDVACQTKLSQSENSWLSLPECHLWSSNNGEYSAVIMGNQSGIV